ncbi:MAG: hypothetical protein A2Y48_10495 [Nitrospirae bacterium RIFCSPLOW2_12_42_9]|nr:MAG: hypothetical protein A2Z60_00385 [Nitrospirae bacterium RIFCSPLOWO2_02_42_7]OGW59247.1 MAG: hypothetical protein A3D21_03255 [Nitrospirae bacterium RIFCSPHIGHO2_02_FULL_42_12]OGW62197.1 MAG: hypothetical protein A2Y48_10495 [Nitrospirae bacterium RIFCSPLOW2_12_42_9]HBI23592.1 hypothetical protein [Nitrospiraceae bacterium]
MTRLIIETDDKWTREKIRLAIDTEIYLLKKALDKVKEKIKEFEIKYGELDRESLYGKIDDMELIEWEGETETLQRIQKRLKSLEEIVFEYR